MLILLYTQWEEQRFFINTTLYHNNFSVLKIINKLFLFLTAFYIYIIYNLIFLNVSLLLFQCH